MDYFALYVIMDMSVMTQGGDTALVKAARKGNTEVVAVLVKAGATKDLHNEVRCYIANCISYTGCLP